MELIKLLFLAALAVTLSASVSCTMLDYAYPVLMSEFYASAPTKEVYRRSTKERNGSKREEMGVIMNPGTPDEQMVVMSTYSTYDEKSGIEVTTVHTADKGGRKRVRYMFTNHKLSSKTLKLLAAGG